LALRLLWLDPAMRLLPTTLALLLAAPAFAQVAGTLTATVGGADRVVVGSAACAETLTLSWAATAASACPNSLKFWITSGECNDAIGTGDHSLGTVSTFPTQPSGTISFAVLNLPGLRAADAGCGAAGLELTHKICGVFQTPGGFSGTSCSDADASEQSIADPPEVVYDSTPPARPVISKVLALDSALRVEIETINGASTVRVEYRLKGTEPFLSGPDVDAASSTSRIADLLNGQTYEVRVVAVDEAGNTSEPSEVVEGIPVETQGFFGRYRAEGGTEQGGCSAVGGASWVAFASLAAGVVFARFRRRRR
jgi:hypothetical protein